MLRLDAVAAFWSVRRSAPTASRCSYRNTLLVSGVANLERRDFERSRDAMRLSHR